MQTFTSTDDCLRFIHDRLQPGDDVQPLILNGKRCFLKPVGVKHYGPLRSVFTALAVRIALGHWPEFAALNRSPERRLAFEGQRLRSLFQAGESVPKVLVTDTKALVISDAGATLDQQMRPMDAEKRFELIERWAFDQVRFHEAGHWHGAAQIRNISWDGERFCRFDFEEDLTAIMPLSMCQAIDIFLGVYSLVGEGALGDMQERQALAIRYLATYRRNLSQCDLDTDFELINRWLKRVVLCVGWTQNFAGNDIKVIVGTHRVMSTKKGDRPLFQ